MGAVQRVFLRLGLRVGLWLLLAGWSVAAPAATLVAIVSERNAGELVQAAHRFQERYPQHRLRFRSTAQVEALSEAELRALLQDADALFLAGAFKDTAQRLLPLLQASPAPRIIALAGDRSLGLQSRWNGRALFAPQDARYEQLSSVKTDTEADAAWVARSSREHPALTPWISARGYWQNRGDRNLVSLLALLLAPSDARLSAAVQPVEDAQALRVAYGGRWIEPQAWQPRGKRRLVAILEDERADRGGEGETGEALCRALDRQKLDCVRVLARWGKSSSEGLSLLKARAGRQLGAVVSLQDFVIGGSSDRANATRAIEALDVPVLKGVRLHDLTAEAWRLSASGLPWDSVYYRIAMPELQGIGQPIVVAAAAPISTDALTGISVARLQPLPQQFERLAARAARWVRLQTMDNADKRIALIYYNHPPGRHNIGADNLDVPASLLQILGALQQAGYDTGPLPATAEALLERLQEDGVNLPENGAALQAMARRVTTLDGKDYAAGFAKLPQALQRELRDGPLGLLQARVQQARQVQLPQAARDEVERTLKELRHLVEGARHPARARALDLLTQLDAAYARAIVDAAGDAEVERLTRALVACGIEGLRGWGVPPGYVMVDQGRFVLPGLRFGKVFVGPQPPRGWQLNEELLHANTSVPPPHQYLAFYHWLKNGFKADAIVHLGRHSTYEFLPHKSVGQDEHDYPALIADEIPGVYPYIVDGVGEGLQAKRRGLAVMVDHLTPPLAATPLYDDLLRLRQLVESYEAASNPALRTQAARDMRALIDKLHLREPLTASMDEELKVRGIRFEQADDELLVHEIGHYLTRLQEDFMPLGLHVFGRPWKPEAVQTLLTSMQAGTDPSLRARLEASPAAELRGLLQGLAGRFVPAGPGNDPIRNADALPTGRNFHGLDNSLVPSPLGYGVGEQLAAAARSKAKADGKEAVILWASDSVRDEGAMIGFGLALLGVTPEWNSRGIVIGLKRRPLAEVRQRADTLFIASGLFRDLFGAQIGWLDKAVLLALDGSRQRIEREQPQLKAALAAALAPLGPLARPGDESLRANHVARHWIDETKLLLQQGRSASQAGREAALRVFGTAPGDYGAGINRLAERSGAWTDRHQLAQAYMNRIGHAYGADGFEAPQHALLQSNLRAVDNTYLGRSSNLYGLIDNNDAFDYLGGLSLAVETLSGQVPSNHVIDNSRPDRPQMQPLPAALLGELRGRFLNPAWIQPLMQHGYAGARTMGSEFVEYLWGWQVTNPDIIKSWAWDEVKAVYLDDRYQIGLDRFLEQGANVHVKTNMMAILMVAAHKGFWQADAATLQALGQQWVDLLLAHGLPGSGHTRPDHPVFTWVRPYLREDQRAPLQKLLQDARVATPQADAAPSTISELQPAQDAASNETASTAESDASPVAGPALRGFLVLVLALMLAGFLRGRYGDAAIFRKA